MYFLLDTAGAAVIAEAAVGTGSSEIAEVAETAGTAPTAASAFIVGPGTTTVSSNVGPK